MNSQEKNLHELPIQLIQDFISIIRGNEHFEGEGKIDNYTIIKQGDRATIFLEDKYTFIANFKKEKDGNWYFVKEIGVAPILEKSTKIIKEVLHKKEK